MKEKETAAAATNMAMIHNMSVEEKLKLLDETDKAYIRGYIERAVMEQQKQRAGKAGTLDKTGVNKLHLTEK